MTGHVRPLSVVRPMIEPLAHLEALASIGVQGGGLTWLARDGQVRAHLPALPLARLRASLPFWAAGSRERGTGSLVLRPAPPPGLALVQLDDLLPAALARVLPLCLFALETSPSNHQAWLALAGLGEDGPALTRALKAATGADVRASGACRVAGSLNCKEKYFPNYPLVRLLAATPGRLASLPELEESGLLPPGWRDAGKRASGAAPAFTPSFPFARRPRPYRWPDYARALAGAPPAGSHLGPDRSRADFFWCCLALRAGWGKAETAAELARISEKARDAGGDYVQYIVSTAAAAVTKKE